METAFSTAGSAGLGYQKLSQGREQGKRMIEEGDERQTDEQGRDGERESGRKT